MRNKSFNQIGLSLIELILTLALLGIIFTFMFTFFQFNYSTFFRSISEYDIQSSLNNVSRFIEEELRYSNQIKIIDNNNFFEDKNYIYRENGVIFLKTNEDIIKKITDDNIVLIERISFKLSGNLVTYEITGKSKINNEEYTVKSTIELLNIKNSSEKIGVAVEYNLQGR